MLSPFVSRVELPRIPGADDLREVLTHLGNELDNLDHITAHYPVDRRKIETGEWNPGRGKAVTLEIVGEVPAGASADLDSRVTVLRPAAALPQPEAPMEPEVLEQGFDLGPAVAAMVARLDARKEQLERDAAELHASLSDA